MRIICKNCRKLVHAKNAMFCSSSCYKFYTDALERDEIDSLEENKNMIKNLNEFSLFKFDQTQCIHEYSRNGTMSCRKCGHTSY